MFHPVQAAPVRISVTTVNTAPNKERTRIALTIMMNFHPPSDQCIQKVFPIPGIVEAGYWVCRAGSWTGRLTGDVQAEGVPLPQVRRGTIGRSTCSQQAQDSESAQDTKDLFLCHP